jgi:hypothetical protein
MRRLSIALLALVAGSLPALAEEYVTEKGHLICTTAQGLRDAQDAISKHDRAWLDSIKECSLSTPGLKVEMLQDGALTTKVRIYDESGKPTIYWTSRTTLKEVRH